MRWWNIQQSLYAHLVVQLDGTSKVVLGADAFTPSERTVIVKRGPVSQHLPSHGDREGQIAVVLECWASANEDRAAGNLDLQELENTVAALLDDWVRAVRTTWTLTLQIRIDPDGDFFRPSLGSQMTVDIGWRIAR